MSLGVVSITVPKLPAPTEDPSLQKLGGQSGFGEILLPLR